MQNTSRLILIAGAFLLQPTAMWAEDFSNTSPNGRIKATVHLVDGKLTYTVTKDGRTLVDESPLGLKTTLKDLTEGLSLVSSATAEIDDPYWLPVGKQTSYRDRCNILSVITSKGTWRQTVQFRLYDDGFAFRYVIPKYGGNTMATLTEEMSRIRLSNFTNCLACRFIGNIQSPNYPYEGRYTYFTNWTNLIGSNDDRFNAPALVYDGTDYILLSEADNRGIFCTSLIKAEATKGEFSYSWTGATKDYAQDKEHKITCQLPAYTPWRMAVVGSLADMFGTTMTENLCPATAIDDMGWIKPGVSAWYWGGSDGNKSWIQKEYGGLLAGETAHADLAAEMGWTYTLIDGGWSKDWVPGLVEHAAENGVKSLLWQTARLSDNQQFSNANMEATLKQWAAWGIKGIKIDFWEDDSKEAMERMENLYKLCAKYKMLVNYHGCTRPSGLRRTYPHIMTQEGIYGGENQFWAAKNITAQHHLNLIFTRNVVGAADYTPGDFATWYGSIITQQSMGHHLALLTAFESGIVHIAECPQNIRYFLGKDIMKRLPTVWDESRLLEGDILKYATIARRNGEDWWVAGINTAERTCKLDLDFLEEGKTYTAYIYRDGSCRSELKFNKMEVTKGTPVSFKELSEGGFLMQISPNPNLDVPAERTTYEAESTLNTLSTGVTRANYNSLHASAGAFVKNIGLGRKLQFNRVKADNDGEYLLTIYYITKDKRYAKLLVNDEQVGDTITYEPNNDITNTFDPEGMGWKMIPVRLRAGYNTITIQSYSDLWAPNFDRITIHPLSGEATGIKAAEASASAGKDGIYDLSGKRLASVPYDGIYIKDGKKYAVK